MFVVGCYWLLTIIFFTTTYYKDPKSTQHLHIAETRYCVVAVLSISNQWAVTLFVVIISYDILPKWCQTVPPALQKHYYSETGKTISHYILLFMLELVVVSYPAAYVFVQVLTNKEAPLRSIYEVVSLAGTDRPACCQNPGQIS